MSAIADQAQIGAYRITRLIDRGGQGSVYLGYDTLLRRRVAIKIYAMPEERAARRKLVREAQLVASLDSPRIVPVFDVIESEHHLAMVMAYVPGCSLETFLASARPSLECVITVITDIAGALATARQSRVIHGDVKPANVLLGDDGHARLTDFGIARRPMVPADRMRGGASYWSLTPEHLRNEPITEQADIFALGVLLYRMLTLAHPFAADDGRLNTTWMLERDPVPLAGRVQPELEVPPELDALLAQMLHRDPRQRPRNTRGIRQVLHAIARTIPLTSGSAVLNESRPFFRPESPADVPVDVPRELARSGRSRKEAPEGVWGLLRYWFTGLSRFSRAALVGSVVIVSGVAAVQWYQARPVAVAFEAPQLRIGPDVVLPEALSTHWLIERLREAVRRELGPIDIRGSVGAEPARVLYSPLAAPPPPGPPRERFAMTIDCAQTLCVLALGRETRDERVSERTVLTTHMSAADWEEAIVALVSASLRRD